MVNLLDKLNIKDEILLKNRIVMPPMCTYQANNMGEVNNFHKIHYGARALGGVGMIIVEATAVEPRGRITNSDLGLWDDKQIVGHRDMVEECHKYVSKMVLQIAHSGRKSRCSDSHNVGASPISFSEDYDVPYELTKQEINEIKQKFVSAANRAKEANYDAVEIHAAHGYLLNSFMSPLSNLRKDEYGGSFENRIRLLKEVIMDIKDNVDIPIVVRISATEWNTNGWDLTDSILLAREIEELIDIIHISAGGNIENPDMAPKFLPLYQVPYAKAIKENVKIPVIAVGLITDVNEANALLIAGNCDLVAFGRELLRNPNLPQYAAKILQKSDGILPAYARAFTW